MQTTSPGAQIAVVGLGPRGLGALEALADRTRAADASVAVDIFDPFPAPGAGPNFDPTESPLCRLNIPVRDVSIRRPDGASRPAFAEWLQQEREADPDAFPPRAELGRYLQQRYAALRRAAPFPIKLRAQHVEHLERREGGWMLWAGGRWRGPYAEVLLTLGQPEVAPDDQLAEWRRHAQNSDGVLAQAYPAKRLAKAAEDWAGKTVAIRGFALSAFDVLRLLTIGRGGRVEGSTYVASGDEPARILPFSLDGKPPFPKPETEALDARFDPTPEETDRFQRAISEAAAAQPSTAKEQVGAALVEPVTRVLRRCGAEADANRVAAWLAAEWRAPGGDETSAPLEALRAGVAMADGSIAPSIGYVVGQVWRKWQDELREGYNPSSTPPETAEALVAFDEGLKRFSYGQPVASSRELIALVEAGVVDLRFAADPEIDLTQSGWRLSSDGKSAAVAAMVDSVLPSPALEPIEGCLIRDLSAEGRLSTVTEGLAARTTADGTVIAMDGRTSPGLCLLGRLALGSVIAADSLHDCFGDAADRWARGVLGRLE